MSTYPPDGWTVGGTDVTWANDFAQETSTVLKGGNSVKFKDTTPTGDPYLYSDLIPVEYPRPYGVEFNVRADSVAAGNTITLQVFWYQSNGTSAASTASNDIFATAVLSAADTWLTLRGIFTPPSNACFARLRMTKNNTAFNAYLDNAEIYPHVYAFCAKATDLDITNSFSTDITFDTELYDYGNAFILANNYFLVPISGIYTFSTTMMFTENLSDGTEVFLSIARSDPGSGLIGMQEILISGTHSPILNISGVTYCEKDTYVYINTQHDYTEARLVNVYFSGALVE